MLLWIVFLEVDSKKYEAVQVKSDKLQMHGTISRFCHSRNEWQLEDTQLAVAT